MSVAIITGSAGLVGSEAVTHFAKMGMDVLGIAISQQCDKEPGAAPALPLARKKSVLGILIDPVDHDAAVERVVDAARDQGSAGPYQWTKPDAPCLRARRARGLPCLLL